MCGIAGFIGRGDTRDLARMSAALEHRGPDGYGEWTDPQHGFYLAVRRLAILDRESAAQPMRAPHQPIVVAYNGEIYNHAELRRELEQAGSRFVTNHSDTEVLLNGYREWGPALTTRLNGMWAFAIYDSCRHTLVLSRDRFGQKPLFYSAQNGTFAFASELTALLQHPAIDRSVSSLSVQKYFAYGFIPAPQSLYQHIFKLPAGCNLLVDTRTLATNVSRYWDFALEEDDSPDDARTESALAERLRFLLRDAVRRQFQADVPVGVFLSGGIDSSALSYFAAQQTPHPIDTFSIGFDHPAFDETDQALSVSALLGTRHTVKRLSSADARCVLPRIASVLDEPIGDSSIVSTHVLCEVARQKVTVALGGEGADELFGGYDPFRALRLARLYSQLVPKPVHRAIRLVAARLPSRSGYMPLDYRLTRMLRGLSYPPALWNPTWIGPLEPSELQDCFEDCASIESIYSEAIDLWDSSRQSGLVEKTMQFYVKLYFQDDILAKVDRAGMMNSLETKYLFKQAMRPLLPASIVDQRKHGFAVPMAQWLREGWLVPPTGTEPGGPRPEFVNRNLTAHRLGAENNAVFLWSLWLLRQILDARADL